MSLADDAVDGCHGAFVLRAHSGRLRPFEDSLERYDAIWACVESRNVGTTKRQGQAGFDLIGVMGAELDILEESNRIWRRDTKRHL